jgi:hypothetical protein
MAGPSGVLLVVLALAWWGASVGLEGRDDRGPDGWETAVSEVSGILGTLLSNEKQEGKGQK